MIDQVLLYNIPAGLALLPAKMRTVESIAMLLTIGLQESRFMHRRQGGGGPARGFWQFEAGGVRGVLEHPDTQSHAANALLALRYTDASAWAVLAALEHNDTLAAVFARLLLWTLPGNLPDAGRPDRAWSLYLDGWRPGAPIRETWASFYVEAWERTTRAARQTAQLRKA